MGKVTIFYKENGNKKTGGRKKEKK